MNYLLLNYLLSYHPPITPPFEKFTNNEPLQEIHLSYKIENVPTLNQMPILPTGCEAAATAMLLQWAGVKVSMSEIADLLPKGLLPSERDGKIIGGNPSYEFVGDPFSNTGLGVYNQPISDIVDYYLNNQSENISGCSFEHLIEILDSNRPIIVWATINMQEPSINSVWQDEQGNEVIWKTPEHAMVLVGYNSLEIIVNDPLIGKKVTYDKATFISCWEAMGRQAVTILQ